MQMVRAIIRPEKETAVIAALEDHGFVSLTKMDVFGRGKQKGIEAGGVHYEELPKVLLMLVVPSDRASRVVETIEASARTGSVGDGKVFVTPVDAVYTVRTGSTEL